MVTDRLEIMKSIVLFFILIITFLEFGQTQGNEDRVRMFVSHYSNRQLVKLLVNGSTTVERTVNTTGNPWGIDYDHVNKHIYWTEQSPPAIKRSDINFENVTTILSLPSGSRPYYLAVAKELRKLFYTDDHQIVSMDLTGSNLTTILDSTSVAFPRAIVIYSVKRQIIWSEIGSDKKISSADYDGSNIKRIVNTSSQCLGLTLDEEADILYWNKYKTGLIQSVSLDGSNRRVIYNDTTKSLYDLFLLDTSLYFTAHSNYVYRISVDVGAAEAISETKFSNPYGLYVLSDNVRECPAGTFGSDCTSCSTRHCQGELDCPADGTCSQGCQNGYRGQTCTQDCESGFYGSGCSLSCSNRSCDDDLSGCDHVTGQCIEGCKSGYHDTDCSQKCDSGSYGPGCGLACGDRRCLDSTSDCYHVTGQCVGGCQAGYNGTDCVKQCSPGVAYGVNCEKSCNARHCVRSSTACDPQNGQCPNGCELTWRGVDCTTQCPAGTFGTFCTSCIIRHCQGESDCPADGTCSQGCQDGYVGDSCTRTETNNSSVVLLVCAIAGAVVGTLLIGAVVLFCLYRYGRQLWTKPAQESSANIQMSTIDGQLSDGQHTYAELNGGQPTEGQIIHRQPIDKQPSYGYIQPVFEHAATNHQDYLTVYHEEDS